MATLTPATSRIEATGGLHFERPNLCAERAGEEVEKEEENNKGVERAKLLNSLLWRKRREDLEKMVEEY